MKQVQKSKRTAAKVELMRIAQLQESFYVQNLSYASTFQGNSSSGGLGFANPYVTTEGGDYFVTLTSTKSDGSLCTGTAATPCTAYTLIALPYTNSPQVHDSACIGFKLTNTGSKGAVSQAHQSYGNASIRDECW
jgi:type IV pilus assembly protein PilE